MMMVSSISHLIFSVFFSFGTPAAACNLECQEVPSVPPLVEFGAPSESQLPSNRLKVIAWNLYKGKDPQFAEIFPHIARQQDVILLSEVVTADFMRHILLDFSGTAWHIGGSFIMEGGHVTGTAIGSKTRAHDVQVFRTSDLEPFVKTPKTITAGKYRLPNSTEEFLVLSIHGINWKGDAAIVRQVQDVMPLLEAHRGPILFAGDFNFKNKKRLQMVSDLLSPVGLRRVNWENPLQGKQLDDAFSRGMKVHRAYLLHDYVDLASDHPALMFDLEIQPNRD